MRWYVCISYMVIVALSHYNPTEAIDPEYELINRISETFLAAGNTFNSILDINQLPIEEKVTFWCATPSRKTYMQAFVNDEDLASKIDLTLPVAFIIHGWVDNSNRTWAKKMVNDYVSNYDTNVCFVDWGKLAGMEYTMAASNTVVVANYLAEFIRYLGTVGISLDQINLVGHSMGAQICGLTGALFDGLIPVIIGLDPAGWCFTKPFDKGYANRLDKSDARYVQVIHTNDDVLGTQLTAGHQDFYSYSGNSPQPGCVVPILEGGMTYLQFTCSHYKAVEFFGSSLSGTNFRARWCLSYAIWFARLCEFNKQDNIGLDGNRTPNGTLYFSPKASYPYM